MLFELREMREYKKKPCLIFNTRFSVILKSTKCQKVNTNIYMYIPLTVVTFQWDNLLHHPLTSEVKTVHEISVSKLPFCQETIFQKGNVPALRYEMGKYCTHMEKTYKGSTFDSVCRKPRLVHISEKQIRETFSLTIISIKFK